MAWKFPNLSSFLIEIIPPPKPDQKPACDIFDSPEVERTKNDDNDEGINIWEEIAKNEIAE